MERGTVRLGILAVGLVGAVGVLAVATGFGGRMWKKVVGKATVADRVQTFEGAVRGRIEDAFRAQGLAWGKGKIAFLCFKEERVLEVYGRTSAEDSWRLVKSYPVLGQSGGLGPKRKEGDRQVPEGIYEVESLNPNSRFHLSIRVNYPNAFDREQAEREGRTQLGGDIMIHGSDRSVGCLAMGDEAAEDLFVLVAIAETKRVPILISPRDLRKKAAPDSIDGVPWAPELYRQLQQALAAFPHGDNEPR
ncbi:MAG TPA: L,D-transpeptidase family protein [Planctomycetota bacterium]|jgi:hypothetical protein|nr:L,D-transpeptidase family protein [Planctomycetota bacterium]